MNIFQVIQMKEQLKCVREIIAEDPERTRVEISRRVCRALDWYKPDGGLQEMSCRVALLRMEMNMLIEKYYIPSGTSFENNAHKHYYNGCVLLDNAIKEVFFGDLLIRVRDSTFYNKIDISYEEFMVVITRYNRSNWIPETLLKVYLLEVFTKVIRLFRKMRY